MFAPCIPFDPGIAIGTVLSVNLKPILAKHVIIICHNFPFLHFLAIHWFMSFVIAETAKIMPALAF